MNTELYGSVDYRVANDSLFLEYSLRWTEPWDEIVIQPLGWEERVVYRLFESEKPCTSGGCVTEGVEGFALNGANVPRGCQIEARRDSSVLPTYRWVEFNHYGTFDATLVPPVSYGYQWTKLDDSHADKCLTLGVGFAVAATYRRWQFNSSYMGSWGSDFASHEIIPIAARRYFGGRNRFAPSLELGAAHSSLRVSPPEWRIEEKEWGAMVGAAIDGPFERLSYRYCTALDGYHTVGLSFALAKTENFRMGTTYEYVHYDKGDMVRVVLLIEGVPMGGGFGLGHGSTDLTMYNDRPWWHKALSVPALVPAVVVMYAIGTVFGGLGGQ